MLLGMIEAPERSPRRQAVDEFLRGPGGDEALFRAFLREAYLALDDVNQLVLPNASLGCIEFDPSAGGNLDCSLLRRPGSVCCRGTVTSRLAAIGERMGILEGKTFAYSGAPGRFFRVYRRGAAPILPAFWYRRAKSAGWVCLVVGPGARNVLPELDFFLNAESSPFWEDSLCGYAHMFSREEGRKIGEEALKLLAEFPVKPER